MCRSIKTLRRYDEPATDEEVAAAARQFVRKVSGFHRPSAANEAAFEAAVTEVADAARRLLGALPAARPPRPSRTPVDSPAAIAPARS